VILLILYTDFNSLIKRKLFIPRPYILGSGETMSRILDLTEYVVVQSLLDPKLIDALYDYHVNGLSPSDISIRYGIPKHLFRRHIQYVYTRSRMNGVLASRLFKIVVDAVRRINIAPVFEHPSNTVAVCKLCGRRVPAVNNYNLWLHLIKEHRDVVDELINLAIAEIERIIKERRNGNNGKKRRADKPHNCCNKYVGN